jgi:isopenicillin N synthase-like dioxygenase
MAENEKYDNLRTKTIFDFTRDEKILKKVLSEESFEEYMENPDEKIEESKDWQERSKIGYIIEFAEITKNTALYESLKREFGEIYPNFFRKVSDPLYYV